MVDRTTIIRSFLQINTLYHTATQDLRKKKNQQHDEYIAFVRNSI